ncbi:hypothetical protein [Streptomyces sp. NPDC052114]|uniref:hypothetical protein n=1 Tax=unclassified Streptomyces TaxID=2593676 RepID=UPI003421A3D4
MAVPRAAPAPPRAQDAEPELPVFVDESGWRRRALQGAALVVGGVCLGYLAFVGTLASGLLQPVGTQPPRVDGPSAQDDDGRQAHRSGGAVRAEARQAAARERAERDKHRRPPAGRSAPPAGGPRR